MIFFSSDPSFKQIYKSFKKSGFEIDLLVSEKAKEAGRGQKEKDNSAVQFAKEINLKTITPDFLDIDALQEIKSTLSGSKDQIGFVFAYGKIIPQTVIDAFDFGIFNLHPSLLPLYRGATPIQSALLDGKEKTGYSVIKIISRLDAGNILFQKNINIDKDDDFISLGGKIIDDFIKEAPSILKMIQGRDFEETTQDEAKATYTRKFVKSDGEIKNSDTANTALLKIRAFANWPKTYIILGDKRLIIHKAHLEGEKLSIDIIQKESGKPMKFCEFKKGNQTLLTQLPDFVRI